MIKENDSLVIKVLQGYKSTTRINEYDPDHLKRIAKYIKKIK
jgi:hypothetical protein